MSKYKLIAFDMDGTLLDDKKDITPKTTAAIGKAAEAGKVVILNTGRSPAELVDYMPYLPGVRYFNCISGGLVYDSLTGKAIAEKPLATDVMMKILDIADREDIMLQALNSEALIMNRKDLSLESLTHFQMAHYKESYDRAVTPREDLAADYRKAPFPVFKINLYHTDAEARERTRVRLLEAGLPVQMANAETASIELSPAGVHKGHGMEVLCGYLGLEIGETIVVGDSDNDLAALETGGLAVAMGNSNEKVLAVSDVVVADNNHDGCAEAIEKYLL